MVMVDRTKPQGGRPARQDRRKGRDWTDFNLLSFLPLFVVIAYWTRVEAVLFVVSFMFPLLLAFRELLGQTVERGREVRLPRGERDSLTGLPTRRAALGRLARFLEAERNTGRETVLLLVDIDRFRSLNDRFGMETADRILVEVADRLKSCVRENDLVARVGNDDFAIILNPIRKADIGVALSIADRVGAAIAQPFAIDRISCHLTCSIGICLSGRAPESDADSMFHSAEVALEHARREGPGATRSFSPRMRREAQKLQALSAELDAALENGQIRPWFQPQISTDTGEVVGFEALARWDHPQQGLILPGLFLKAIEANGKSERLSEVILYHALSAMKAWDRAGFRVPTIGVNFSTDELRNPKLVEKIKWEVDRFDIAPARVTIEVLENVVTEHDDDVITRNIRALAAQGFNIDLDDFGTGHAAIANIRRFAVTRIKIDRSFVKGIDHDPEQATMTGAIIRMAESLGLDTLAEGVETPAEQSRLAELGCRHVQGYGIARPMPFEDSIAWLTAHREQQDGLAGRARRAG